MLEIWYETLKIFSSRTDKPRWLKFGMSHRGPTGGLLLLHGFSGVADIQGISGCLNALLLSNLHPCFVRVFSLILSVAHDDTTM